MIGSRFFKKEMASIMASLGLTQMIIKRKARKEFVILMYHKILRSGTSTLLQPGMYVNSETFEKHLDFISYFFEVKHLCDLANDINGAEHVSLGKPTCALTFDDGWMDFYENAYPALRSRQIPATVFLPTEFIGSAKWFWTDSLAQMVDCRTWNEQAYICSGQQKSNPIARIFSEKIGSREGKLERVIALLNGFDEERRDRLLSDFVLHFGRGVKQESRVFLTWEHIKEMHGSGLIAFGSHTAGHKILTLCSDEEVVRELASSKTTLLNEKAVDEDFVPFCYPNGSFDERIRGLVCAAGYHMAVTTEKGWNKWNSNILSLRRIGIHQDMASTNAMYACRIVGLI